MCSLGRGSSVEEEVAGLKGVVVGSLHDLEHLVTAVSHRHETRNLEKKKEQCVPILYHDNKKPKPLLLSQSFGILSTEYELYKRVVRYTPELKRYR